MSFGVRTNSGHGRFGPVRSHSKQFVNGWQRTHVPKFAKFFWRRITDPEYVQPSVWTGDFKHRYLANTGRDYVGPLPASPAAGMYRGFSTNKLLQMRLGKNAPVAERESRHLPVMPITPRAVFEYKREVSQDYFAMVRSDKRVISQLKENEFHEWYMKLQRVRGKWCRENSIRSRGVYGPAVDAAEIWG